MNQVSVIDCDSDSKGAYSTKTSAALGTNQQSQDLNSANSSVNQLENSDSNQHSPQAVGNTIGTIGNSSRNSETDFVDENKDNIESATEKVSESQDLNKTSFSNQVKVVQTLSLSKIN